MNINLNEDDEIEYIQRWIQTSGHFLFGSTKQAQKNAILSRIKDKMRSVAETLSDTLNADEETHVLDFLVGLLMANDPDFFLNSIKDHGDLETEKEKQENQKLYQKIYDEKNPLRDVYTMLLKDHNASMKSVKASMLSGKKVATSKTSADKDSFIAAKRIDVRVSTLTAFYVALDLYPKLNRSNLNDSQHIANEVIHKLANLLSFIINEAFDIYHEERNKYQEKPDNDKIIKEYAIKKVCDEWYTFDTLKNYNEQTIKTLAHQMSGFIYRMIDAYYGSEEGTESNEFKSEYNAYKKAEGRYIGRIVMLVQFIHEILIYQTEFKNDIDLEIYKDGIGHEIAELLDIQRRFKTRRRSKIDIMNDNAISQWYYDVYFDNKFYNNHGGSKELSDFIDKKSQETSGDIDIDDYQREVRRISARNVEAAISDYNNAFLLTIGKTSSNAYQLNLRLGVMTREDDFFAMYVNVLRDYKDRLATIAFMPFDDTLYHIVGRFPDLIVSYDNSNQQIVITGKANLSGYEEKDKKTFFDDISNDMAMLQSPFKRVEIIDQLRKDASASKRSSPFQAYIQKLYDRIHGKIVKQIDLGNSQKPTETPENTTTAEPTSGEAPSSGDSAPATPPSDTSTPATPAAPETTATTGAPEATSAPTGTEQNTDGDLFDVFSDKMS